MKISGPTVLVIHPLPRAREMGSSGKNVCFLVAGLAYTLLFFFFFFLFLFFRVFLMFSTKASAVEGACPLLARWWLAHCGAIPTLPGKV
jgi:hypothetical protein